MLAIPVPANAKHLFQPFDFYVRGQLAKIHKGVCFIILLLELARNYTEA